MDDQNKKNFERMHVILLHIYTTEMQQSGYNSNIASDHNCETSRLLEELKQDAVYLCQLNDDDNFIGVSNENELNGLLHKDNTKMPRSKQLLIYNEEGCMKGIEVDKEINSDGLTIIYDYGASKHYPEKTAHVSPMQTNHFSHVQTTHFSPVQTNHFSPVKSSNFSAVKPSNFLPVQSTHFSPVQSTHASAKEDFFRNSYKHSNNSSLQSNAGFNCRSSDTTDSHKKEILSGTKQLMIPLIRQTFPCKKFPEYKKNWTKRPGRKPKAKRGRKKGQIYNKPMIDTNLPGASPGSQAFPASSIPQTQNRKKHKCAVQSFTQISVEEVHLADSNESSARPRRNSIKKTASDMLMLKRKIQRKIVQSTSFKIQSSKFDAQQFCSSMGTELSHSYNSENNKIASEKNERSLVKVSKKERSLVKVGKKERSLVKVGKNDRALVKVGKNDKALVKVGKNDKALVKYRQRYPKELEKYGPETLPPGWSHEVRKRKTGKSAGNIDVYFINPEGKRMRSRAELATYIEENGLPYSPGEFCFRKGAYPVPED